MNQGSTLKPFKVESLKVINASCLKYTIPQEGIHKSLMKPMEGIAYVRHNPPDFHPNIARAAWTP